MTKSGILFTTNLIETLHSLNTELTTFIIWGPKLLRKIGHCLLFSPYQQLPHFSSISLCFNILPLVILILQIEKKSVHSTFCLSLLPLG